MTHSGEQPVRLSRSEREGILRAVQKSCDERNTGWKRVLVFGSRANVEARGGDIDLLIELDPQAEVDTYRLEQRLRMALEEELGEQKIDIVLDKGDAAGAFVQIAREQGVELWTHD